MITRLSLSGYRLLDGFEADLGRLTVVIGANACGKSTLLDWLQLVRDCAILPLSGVVTAHGGMQSILTARQATSRVHWQLTLQKPSFHAFWQTMPLDEQRQLVYEVSIGTDLYGQPTPDLEELRNAQPYAEHARPLKLLQATPRKTMIYDHRQHRLVDFDEATSAQASHTHAGPAGIGDGGEVEPPQLAQQEKTLRLAQMRFLNEYPLPSWVRALIASWAFYPGFDLGRLGALRTKPAEIRPETILNQTGENLGAVLHEMVTRASFRAAADDLRAYLRSAYPFFEDVFAETAYAAPARALVRVREEGITRLVELWELSDGFLRFLCLGAALLNPVPPPFVAIDEPEAGLHPRLMSVVGDMIKDASERMQVLVTTHSPDLLSRFGIDDVAVMVRDDSKVLWHRPGSRHALRQLLETVQGESLGDLLRSGELEAL